MPLSFNLSQIKRVSDMCFELSKAFSITALGSGVFSPKSGWVSFANILYLVLIALFFFHLSLRLLETREVSGE